MITTVSLLYDLDRKLNKIATNKHQSIELENKIIALNEAQIKLIKQKIDPNNVFQLGFDAFRKRYEDLEFLVIMEEKSSIKKDEDSKSFKYLADIDELKNEYMFCVDLYCLASNEICSDWRLNTRNYKHSDISVVLTNSNTRPSFEYQEIPVTISSRKIELYADKDFSIDNVYVSYIRYPKNIDFQGYIHFDESESETIDCEFPFYLKDELVDLAVQELAMDSGNPEALQNSQMRIRNNE